MKPERLALFVGLVASMSPIAGAQDVPAEQFAIVPLRVHILTDPNIDMANCKMTEDDAKRVVGNVNAIWHRAGVHFGVESVVRERAAQQERFRLTAELGGGQIAPTDLWMLLPRASRAFEGPQVYYFHELPFNSAYMGDDVVFAHEQAQVNPVPGGGKDPVARVTAHALGNLLGLPNVNQPRNLMGGGTSGIALGGPQAEAARKVARTIPGATTVAQLRKAVKAAEIGKDSATARRLRSWLAEIPGAGAADAGRR